MPIHPAKLNCARSTFMPDTSGKIKLRSLDVHADTPSKIKLRSLDVHPRRTRQN
jgi:hypothetical protein